jgi:hypothetical protein
LKFQVEAITALEVFPLVLEEPEEGSADVTESD